MLPTIELPKRKEPWRVWLNSDIHFGSTGHDDMLWGRHVDRACREGWRVVCLGDATEMVTLDAKVARDAIWEQDKLPPAQIEETVRWFEMVAHFDAALDGNHDARFAKTAGASLWDLIVLPRVRSKRSPAKYLAEGGYLVYRQGSAETVLCLTHGEGPVVNSATTLSRMALAMQGAHGYFAGHDHSLWARIAAVEHPGGTRDVWMGRTGTYMRSGLLPYQRRRLLGIPPSRAGSLLLTLDPKGGIADVEILR